MESAGVRFGKGVAAVGIGLAGTAAALAVTYGTFKLLGQIYKEYVNAKKAVDPKLLARFKAQTNYKASLDRLASEYTNHAIAPRHNWRGDYDYFWKRNFPSRQPPQISVTPEEWWSELQQDRSRWEALTATWEAAGYTPDEAFTHLFGPLTRIPRPDSNPLPWKTPYVLQGGSILFGSAVAYWGIGIATICPIEGLTNPYGRRA